MRSPSASSRNADETRKVVLKYNGMLDKAFESILQKKYKHWSIFEQSLRSDKMDCDQNYHSLPHSLPPHRFITKFKIPLFHRNFWNRHVSLFQMFFVAILRILGKTFPQFFELPGGKVGSKVYRHWGAGSPPTNQGKWKAKRKQQLHVLVMGSLETRSHGMGSSWAQFTSFGSCQEF